MAKVTLRLHGADVSRITLEAGMEYIAGRAEDAQIRMEGQRGISRHHLKFYERDGQWVCESLSKFVLIQKGNESVQVLELSENCVFTVPPYEFHFEGDDRENATEPPETPTEGEHLPTFYNPRINIVDKGISSDTSPKVNNEATVAGISSLVPYFRISYPNTADDEVLKLEGQLWIAGRESNCEIQIESPHISRRHFELVRTQEGFFITDLGSSNGTYINGGRITPHEPTRVESGDEIRVMNIEMRFEIRDTQFANHLDNLPVPMFDPILAMPPQPYWNDAPVLMPGADAHANQDYPEHWTKLRPKHLKKVNWKKNKVRIALLVLVPILLILVLTEPRKSEEPVRDPANQGTSLSYDKLNKEQQSVVKDTFKLATSLYVQGKYALCLTELTKLHNLIPQHENSKELESYCEQGLELVRRQQDLEHRERERQQIEQQISGYVETCKGKLSAQATVEDTRQCLAEAMVLSPEHPLVIELIHTAQMREEEAKFLAEQRRKEDSRAAAGDAHFRRAINVYKEGRLAASLTELQKFLNTDYPRDETNKKEARRQIANITKELKVKVDFHLNQCRSLSEKNRFKEAWEACDKALQEEPKNKQAKDMREKMHNNLRKEMKAIYEDSVLEESLGNVESAIEKWKKIISENLPFDEYSKKAKSKIQKYEGL